MSALTTRGAKKSAGPLVTVGLPQVNLLPPSIRAKRALGRTKRMLAYALVGFLLLLGLLGAYAMMHKGAEEARLDDATAETTSLMKQQAQYAEVPRVLGQVDKLESVLAQGFSTDVDWNKYLGALAAVLPDDVRITEVTLTGATPMLAPAEPTDALSAPSVATLTFALRSPDLPKTAEWIDALNGVSGFQDAWMSQASWTLGEEGGAYEVGGTVQISDVAYTGRFSGQSEGE
ncbi:hypothetical protein [Cellulomonas massiliensis]|uniref:hypothetical protein n=1 Tax=Cellulomonas massiliensis TaxID=1465811 RepID=UPI0002F6E1B8|nr:hypothetical protein [Cellulomonas massiliensis]